jgi:hypothetical protein
MFLLTQQSERSMSNASSQTVAKILREAGIPFEVEHFVSNFRGTRFIIEKNKRCPQG